MTNTDLQNFKDLLSKFPNDSNSLEIQLESCLKHLKSYMKVIRDHIPQLQTVLKTENHNYKSIENTELSTQINKLMQIFDKTSEKDLQMLEELFILTKNWQAATAASQATPAEEQREIS